MSGNIPTPVYLYRILHYRNLNFILQNGMNCPNCTTMDPEYVNIGNRDISGKRKNWGFDIEPGGSIHDYVSFYFGPRSPMLFSIDRGYSDYSGPQNEIIYIVTSIPKVIEFGLSFIFTDGHALMATSNLYNDISHLNKIDWNIIFAEYWNDDPPLYTDRKRKRMAEFLIRGNVPVEAFNGIAVMNEEIKTLVERITKDNDSKIEIIVKRDWYY